MALTRKVTVTLPIESVNAIRQLIAEGKADSISGFVQHAVRVSLDDVVGWNAMLADALQETGGEMTAEERDWADRVLRSAPGAAGSAA